jgi:hypothetical protein
MEKMNANNGSNKWVSISPKKTWVIPIRKMGLPDGTAKSISFRDGSNIYVVSFNLQIKKTKRGYALGFADEPDIRMKVDGDE